VIVPAIRGGATVMDQVFGQADGETTSQARPKQARPKRVKFGYSGNR
jgi:hypothetical protein